MMLMHMLISLANPAICGNFCYVYQDEGTDTEELRKQLAEKDDFIKELKQGVNHKSLQSLAEVPLPEGQDKIDQSVNKEVCLLYLQKVCTNDMLLITSLFCCLLTIYFSNVGNLPKVTSCSSSYFSCIISFEFLFILPSPSFKSPLRNKKYFS